ncbi:hypothetical protein DPMN_005470 [Dreissena polymorpha]|uniref:Uncharacterized protein n=1 Tax=Dreissena polymorpha TaxID=45954 RepID=A0A9D4MTL7_DREPO|nr:hypothetical protein DPMN_005470 [Dreissena polymorpha]
MKARSLRTNLIFSGHPETPSGHNEDLFRIIREFIKSKLNMDQETVGILEARKLSRRQVVRSQGISHSRAILVTFSDLRDVNDIMDSAKLLRDTSLAFLVIIPAK